MIFVLGACGLLLNVDFKLDILLPRGALPVLNPRSQHICHAEMLQSLPICLPDCPHKAFSVVKCLDTGGKPRIRLSPASAILCVLHIPL